MIEILLLIQENRPLVTEMYLSHRIFDYRIQEDYSLERITELSGIFSKIVKQKVVDANLIDGAFKFLKENCSKYHLFISSATPQKELVEIIEKKGLSQFFVSVSGSPDTKVDHINNISQKNIHVYRV